MKLHPRTVPASAVVVGGGDERRATSPVERQVSSGAQRDGETGSSHHDAKGKSLDQLLALSLVGCTTEGMNSVISFPCVRTLD